MERSDDCAFKHSVEPLIRKERAHRPTNDFYYRALYGTNPPTSSGHVEGTPSRMRPLSGGSLRNECEAAGKDSGDRRFQATSSSTNSKLVKLMDKFEGYVDQLTSAAAKSDEKIQLLTDRVTYLESRVIRLNNLVERNHPNFRFMQRMVSSIEREAVNGGGHINQSSEDCLEKFLKGLSTAVLIQNQGQATNGKQMEHMQMLLTFLEEQQKVLSREVEALKCRSDGVYQPQESVHLKDTYYAPSQHPPEMCPGSPSGFPQIFSRDVNQVGKPEYYEQLFAEQPPPLEDASSKISNVDKYQRRDSEATEIQAKIKRLKEAMITRYVPKPRDNDLLVEPLTVRGCCGGPGMFSRASPK